MIIKEIASPEELIIDHSQYNAQSLGKYSIIITVSGTNVNQSYEVEVVDYVVGIDLQIASPHYELGEQFSSEDITIYLIMALEPARRALLKILPLTTAILIPMKSANIR